MKKLSAFLTLLVSSLLPLQVFAHNGEVHGVEELTQTEATTAAAGIGVFLIIIFAFMALLFVVSFVFWIMMLIHAAQNDIPDKNMWIIILVVSLCVSMPLIGALVYYFVVKKKFSETKPAPKKVSQNKSK